MEFKSNEIKAGIMILGGIVVLGIFLISIFSLQIGENTKEYRIYLEYVGGITEGTLVKFRGMNVGQVTGMNLPSADSKEPGIELIIEVMKETPIREDSRAFISSISIMAEDHIEISAGSPGSELLAAGEILQGKESLTFARMTEVMGDLSDQIGTLLNRVNNIFNAETRRHLASIIENIDTLLEKGQRPLVNTAQALDQMTSQMEVISANLAVITDTSNGSVTKILENMEQTTKNAQLLIHDLNSSLANLQTAISSNNTNIAEIMENFSAVSQNMEEFTRAIKERPWLLVRKAGPPERKTK